MHRTVQRLTPGIGNKRFTDDDLVRLARPLVIALANCRLILHFGTPKTGTSSIQATLWSNRELLKDHGILYPSNVSSEKRHQYLVTCLRRPVPIALAEGLNASIAEIRTDTQAVLLSAEGLYLHWTQFEAAPLRLFRQLTSAVPTEVIVTLRSRPEFVESLYKQSLENPPKETGCSVPPSIEEFVDLSEIAPTLDYARQLTEIQESLEPELLRVIPYSTSIVDTFLECLPLEARILEEIEPVTSVNPSLSGHAAHVLRLYLENTREPHARQQVIHQLHLLSSGVPSPPLVTQELVDRLRERYKAGDALIRERFGIDVS